LKKILFLSHHDNLLGSSRSLLDLLGGLTELNVEPFVVLPKGGLMQQQLEDRHIPSIIANIPWWMTKQSWSLSKLRKFQKEERQSLKALSEALNEWKIDLIYSNSSVFPIGRMLGMINKTPHVWHIREFGDLDFSLHYIFPKWFCQGYVRTSQAIICNSQAVKKHLFKDWSSEKLHVVYNGVATKARFDQLIEQSQRREHNEVYTFLFIGSISQKKGLEVAIKACAELKAKGVTMRLKIVGSGRESFVTHCRNLAESLSISDFVEFRGYMPDPYDAYLTSDCLLMCSEHEAFGRVTAEAMSACLPVIGRNSGGTPEVIVDDATGYLFNTFEELVEAMQKLTQNPEQGQKMGLAGWQRARDLFNIEDYAANVYKVILSVME